MKMIKGISLLALSAALLASCSKDDNPPNPNGNGTDTTTTGRTKVSEFVQKDGKNIYYVTDLPPATGVSSGTSIPKYFSLITNAEIDSSKKLTQEWDVVFNNVYNSYVTANNPNKNAIPGPSGTGKGALLIVDKAFDAVTEAPSDADFDAAASTAGMQSGSTDGWYTYDMTSHLMFAVANRTIVIRTATGKYAKLEMISLYKGNPATPTLSTPAPYLTFRYWVQQDGSRNLTIK